VNLAGANWPCEQIHSNEREGPVVLVAILADIQSGHKPIVDLVVETAPCSCRRVGASSRPGYPTYAHQSIEVGDLWGSLIGPGPNTGTGGKWWMKIPNGDTPHGIGRGKTVGTDSSRPASVSLYTARTSACRPRRRRTMRRLPRSLFVASALRLSACRISITVQTPKVPKKSTVATG
jgi:hypothetical protein